MFSFLGVQFNNFFDFLKTFYKIFIFLFSKLVDFFNFEFSSLDTSRNKINKTDLLKYDFYSKSSVKKTIHYYLFGQQSFISVDLFYFFLKSYKYTFNNNKVRLFRSYFRAFNTKNGFYFNLKSLKKNSNFMDYLKNIFLSGFKSIGVGLRF
jgi:hypothetical protein